MCMADRTELKRLVKTQEPEENARWARIIIEHLVDLGYSVRIDNCDPFDYPELCFYKEETI